MSRIAAAILVALLAVLAITTVAYAAPRPPAPPYTLGQEIVTEQRTLQTSAPTGIILTCPGNKVVTGGGYSSTHYTPASHTYPSGPNQWVVVFEPLPVEDEGGAGYAFAVCVNP